ncbi:probable tyrosyl-DNA phosphodiesterase [Zophobas morio]|uniref:probable tyrosyl-DNA phosphodiesterase n=1 Tax=Zophobas morio TaxID=2755281 RepID=UPI003082FA26
MATMIQKLHLAAPYNIFYNTIPCVPQQDNTIFFTDLLCPSLGKLKTSLQITFKVDIEWLMNQYDQKHLRSKPLTILYGEENPELEKYVSDNLPNVKSHCVAVSDLHGSHRSKLAIFVYDDDSVRVVVSSANLYQDHWEHFNHCFWVSPLCRMSECARDSPTGFKSDLILFLKQYKLPVLGTWIDYVKRADFHDVRVFLVTSLPGCHPTERPWSLLQQMAILLDNYCDVPDQKDWPVVIQASCLGSYGENDRNWLESTLLVNLQSTAPFQIIYPSVANVEGGIFPRESVTGLRYLKAIHDKQKWLERYLWQWKADKLGRSGVISNCKTLCRISPCSTKVGWFLLTTANAARGGWGQRKYDGIYVRNHEIGVLFIPRFFDEDYFQIDDDSFQVFPIMFDLPLTKYEECDEPWTMENEQQPTQKCSYKLDFHELP